MSSLLFLSPSLPLIHQRSSGASVSYSPKATASNRNSRHKNVDDKNIEFIKDRLDDLRSLASAPALPPFPAIGALPSLSATQRLVAVSAFRALAPTPLDHLCPIPEQPPFNPSLALNLATYAFRAYHDPPSSAYRETFIIPVGDSYTLETDFVYPSTQHIAGKATGLFLLKVSKLDGHITARINHATVRHLSTVGHVSLLRIDHFHDPSDDVLHLYLYNSADPQTTVPSHEADLPLRSIVDKAFQMKRQVSLAPVTITFRPVDYESHRIDFFQASLLPTELPVPYWFTSDKQVSLQNQKHSLSLSVEASFVPFTNQDSFDSPSESEVPTDDGEEDKDLDNKWNVSEAIEALGESIQDAVNEQEEAKKSLNFREQRQRSALAFILRKQLPKGSMPAPKDWNRLAVAASMLSDQIAVSTESRRILDQKATPCLFVESEATDTEVWFFRDVKRQTLVVSFRGTEQVSWRDFFTDAQIFLQRWMPGEDIDLTVSPANTVGLGEFVPSIMGKSEKLETMADDAGAVHYGFLRAYMSVRDAVDRGISLLTNGDNEYRVIFTGHSLGGALATVASGDFAARRGGKPCCMSFGAPKVGNFNFAKRFNELVPNAFRIVNDSDLVSRIPRSLSGGTALDRYKHSGRTVLVNDYGDYWIEGEKERMLLDAGTSISNPFREKYNDLKEMLEHEAQLWEQLLSGISVKHHMEDSYFTAIQQVVRRIAENLDRNGEKSDK